VSVVFLTDTAPRTQSKNLVLVTYDSRTEREPS